MDAPTASPRALPLAAVLLFLPLVGALLEVLAHPEVATQRIGDEAPFEARALTLFDPPALLGPYSRHHWSHPGPLAFWLFGLPYLALGRHGVVIQLAALALNAAALASIVRSVRVLAPSFAARALGLVCVAILVGKVSVTLDPAGTATCWGPACTLLPFAALVLLAAELGTGALGVLPAAVLLHAFVVQTHVLYLVPATLACTLGLGLGMRAAGAEPTRPRALRRAGVVLALLWAPVVVDEVLVSGNLERIAAFFLHARIDTSPSPSAALALFVWRATEPLRDLVGLGPPIARPEPMEGIAAASVAAAGVVVLGVFAGLAHGARRGGAASEGGVVLARIVLVLLVTGAPLLLRVDVPEWPYLTWWIGVLVLLGGIAIGATHLPRALDAHGQRIASIACVAAVAVLGLHTETDLRRASAFAVENGQREADAFEPLFPAVARAHRCRPGLQLDVGAPSLWGVLGATLTHFGREGTRLHVAPGWEFMFGPGYHGGDADARLVILPWDDHGCPAVARSERLRLADCRGEHGQPAARGASAALALTPWEARGVVGDVAQLFDGDAADDGAAWNAPGALVLAGETSSVSFGLPPARVTRLSITSDDNDVLVVESTDDGTHWTPLARVEPTNTWGQRTHEIALDEGRVVRALRVSPLSGDGVYAISEIAVEGEPEAVRVVAAVGAEGALDAITDGRADDDARAVLFEGEAPSVTLELPPIAVAAIAVTATRTRALRVEASVDGHAFWEVGRMPPASGEGIGTRRFHLDDDVLPSHVRLTALAGEAPLRIAEIMPVRDTASLVDVGLRAAGPSVREGFSTHEGDEDWAWIVGPRAVIVVPWPDTLPRDGGADVLVALAPFDGLASPGTLTVRVGDASVLVPLAPGLQTARAHFAAEALTQALAGGALTITLEPSDRISPQALGRSDDARELSLAVHRVEVRPSFPFCDDAGR